MKKLVFTVTWYCYMLLPAESHAQYLIRGNVTTGDHPVAKARITILNGKNSLFTTFTDTDGYYEYCGMGTSDITISATSAKHLPEKVNLEIYSEISFYTVDLKLRKTLQDNFCVAAFFKEGQYKDIYGFDIAAFKETFEEYPGMCIKTICYLYPGETERLAVKRLDALRDLFIRWNIPVERVWFSADSRHIEHKLPEEIYEDCPDLPSITFMVASMEGDCKTR